MKKLVIAFILICSIITMGAAAAFAADGIAGDVDNSGILTANDAAIVLQKVLNNSYKMPIENIGDNYMDYADVDCDGILTSADAAMVLQKVLNSGYKMPVENKEEASTETTTETVTETATETTTEADTENILVAYFSCTNNTETVAMKIAEAANADIYRINAKQPYTEEDLNYNNSNCRANTEQNDPSARPEIDGSIENMADYDIIFIGYPIWWGDAPKIICTFMESYDFSGKTVVPFCTSGGSGISASENTLKALAPAANWLNGRRFSSSASEDSIKAWLSEIGIQNNK